MSENIFDGQDLGDDDMNPSSSPSMAGGGIPITDDIEARRRAAALSADRDAEAEKSGGATEAIKAKPSEILGSSMPFKINKKAILYALLGLIIGVYFVMFHIVPIFNEKEEDLDDELANASYMDVPTFFGKDGEEIQGYDDFDYTLPSNGLGENGEFVEASYSPGEGGSSSLPAGGGLGSGSGSGLHVNTSTGSGASSSNSGTGGRSGGSSSSTGYPSYSGGGGYIDEEELKARSAGIAINIDGESPGSLETMGFSSEGDMFANGLQLPEVQNPADYMQDVMTAMGGGASGAVIPASESSFTTQNNQQGKQDFFSAGGGVGAGYYVSDEHLVAGTVIPALTQFKISSDLPGEVVARVTENVYDGLTGKNLLIPQGSVLIATYSSDISYQQKRVQIAWRYLRRPDGYVVPLGNMPGVDSKGASGSRGLVNNHSLQYLLAMGYASVYSIIVGELTALKDVTNANVNDLINTNQSIMDDAIGGMLSRTLDIQPTITVKAGTRINVFIDQDFWVPPLDAPEVVSPYVRD